jgi:hypothetical protein
MAANRPHHDESEAWPSAIQSLLCLLATPDCASQSWPNMNSLALPRCALILTFFAVMAVHASAASRWSAEQANTWQQARPWAVGCNFNPSTAINQLEMWQAETFDPKTIDRELGWAEQLGFNSLRVFLHNLPWQEDRDGFLKRLDQFLALADQHHISIMFVLLDSCWDPFPNSGRQRDPKPFVHNSGWVQSPGLELLKEPARHEELGSYVKGIIGHFKADRRVLAWDIFNEPDNDNRPAYIAHELPNKAELALALLKKAMGWAREVNPSQPLTVGVWRGPWPADKELSPMERFSLEESDIISFHSYGNLDDMKKCVESLRRFNRPLLCSEYMARPRGSTFDPVLGYLKSQKVGAMNWGFVSGKTQTIYPWDSWEKQYTVEPPVWFHDIFRADGTPFDTKEVEYIKQLTRDLGRPVAKPPSPQGLRVPGQ